jgi:hypothetical protein
MAVVINTPLHNYPRIWKSPALIDSNLSVITKGAKGLEPKFSLDLLSSGYKEVRAKRAARGGREQSLTDLAPRGIADLA